MDLLIKPFDNAIYFIFSSIFSQTLGTLKKNVGRTSCKVVISDPYRASGAAKNTFIPPIIVTTKSKTCAATWLNGRYETTL